MSCFVPYCPNTTKDMPSKTFFSLPVDNYNKKLWFKAVGRPLTYSTMSQCCEDHFDMSTDIEVTSDGMGIMLKEGVKPSRFGSMGEYPRNAIELVNTDWTGNYLSNNLSDDPGNLVIDEGRDEDIEMAEADPLSFDQSFSYIQDVDCGGAVETSYTSDLSLVQDFHLGVADTMIDYIQDVDLSGDQYSGYHDMSGVVTVDVGHLNGPKRIRNNPPMSATTAVSSQPKRKKKEKDPNAPKPPPNAYVRFMRQVYNIVKDQFPPDAKQGEVSKAIGHCWRNLSPEELMPYTAEAEREMVEYKKALDAYNKSKKSAPQLDVAVKDKTHSEKVNSVAPASPAFIDIIDVIEENESPQPVLPVDDGEAYMDEYEAKAYKWLSSVVNNTPCPIKLKKDDSQAEYRRCPLCGTSFTNAYFHSHCVIHSKHHKKQINATRIAKQHKLTLKKTYHLKECVYCNVTFTINAQNLAHFKLKCWICLVSLSSHNIVVLGEHMATHSISWFHQYFVEVENFVSDQNPNNEDDDIVELPVQGGTNGDSARKRVSQKPNGSCMNNKQMQNNADSTVIGTPKIQIVPKKIAKAVHRTTLQLSKKLPLNLGAAAISKPKGGVNTILNGTTQMNGLVSKRTSSTQGPNNSMVTNTTKITASPGRKGMISVKNVNSLVDKAPSATTSPARKGLISVKNVEAINRPKIDVKCPTCLKVFSFPNLEAFNQHVNSHGNDSGKENSLKFPHSCVTCDKKFLFGVSLLKHITKYHGSKKNGHDNEVAEVDPLALDDSTTDGVLNEALAGRLPAEEKEEDVPAGKCPLCGMPYDGKQSLADHITWHINQSNFQTSVREKEKYQADLRKEVARRQLRVALVRLNLAEPQSEQSRQLSPTENNKKKTIKEELVADIVKKEVENTAGPSRCIRADLKVGLQASSHVYDINMQPYVKLRRLPHSLLKRGRVFKVKINHYQPGMHREQHSCLNWRRGKPKYTVEVDVSR